MRNHEDDTKSISKPVTPKVAIHVQEKKKSLTFREHGHYATNDEHEARQGDTRSVCQRTHTDAELSRDAIPG